MKKVFILIPALFIINLSFVYSASIDFSGRLKLFSSIFISKNLYGQYFSHDRGEFGFKRLETRLKMAGEISDNISYFIRFDAFSRPDASFNSTAFPEAGILGSPTQVEPFELSLYEGYIRINHFLSRNMDLTVGKQRIQWGTADKVNVVDNLNPIDFANFFTFDPDYFAERRPQIALNLEYYLSEISKFQLVWLLSRQYAPLPAGFTERLLSGEVTSRIHIDKERFLVKNTNFGLRLSTVLLNTDIGLSYYHGNYHLPVLYGYSALDVYSIDQFYRYPQKNVFGIDLSGEILSVGWWAEVAYVRPEKMSGFVEAPISVGREFQIVKQEVPLFENGYIKYIIGGDYTIGIGNGLYLNAQYLHGFFDEKNYSKKAESVFGFRKGMFFGEIEDYLIARAEYKILNEDLKISIGGIVEFASNETAIFYMPSLEYRALDYVIIQTGAFITTGKGLNTKFGVFKNDKLAFFLIKIDF